MLVELFQVPNVVGILSWMLEVFSLEVWNECKLNLDCRAQRAPSFLAEPPPRFLPKLLDIDEAEALARLRYWGSVLLLSPPLMAATCEAVRFCFLLAKTTGIMLGLFGEPLLYKSLGDTSETIGVEESELESQRIPEIQSAQSTHSFKGADTVECFKKWIIFYHVLCAGIVFCAIWNGWISLQNCGDFAWELWFLWQQLCLWNLFAQNLIRCIMLDKSALKVSTLSSVLLYTVPFVSEPCDTMKDWVMTGICLLNAKSWVGFAIGALVVVLEIIAITSGWIPAWCRISDSLHIRCCSSHSLQLSGML